MASNTATIETPIKSDQAEESETKAPSVTTVEPEPTSKRTAPSSSPSTSDSKQKNKSSDDTTNEEQKAPFHVLMLPVSEQPRTQLLLEPTLLTDRKLRRDYLARRFRAYHVNKSKDGLTMTHGDTALWSGASSLERALVGCCELPPLQEKDVIEMPGGSLARGYEVRFAGLLVKHCHNFKDRVLAMAILERTLEQDQKEAKEELEELEQQQQLKQQQEQDEKEKKDQSKTDEKKEKENAAEEDEEQGGGSSSDSEDEDEEEDEDEDDGEKVGDDDDEWGPKRNRSSPCRRSTRRSSRLQTRSRKRWRPTNRKAKKAQPTCTSTNASSKQQQQSKPEGDRMTIFFSAGGLKILKIWLVDAMTPVYLPMVKGKTRTKPSEFGRMLLPLLHLLSKIPFDKNLIVESKINKQIRKLSKLVDGLIDIFKKENKSTTKSQDELQKALDSYRDPGAGGCVVIRVQEILNKLKATWEEHAKKSAAAATATNNNNNNNNAQQQQQQPNKQQANPGAVKDPFESLKRKIRERLSEIKDMEAGKIGKPEWLTKCEQVQRERERKRPRHDESLPSSVVAAKKVATTEQLALKEREAERAALQDKIKAAQEERKAHLQRLKNQINKRMHSSSSSISRVGTRAATKKRKHAKTVRWKDGLSSDKERNKDVLEEIFVLPKDPAIEEAERAKDAAAKLKIAAAAEAKEQPKEETQPAQNADEDDDDDEDLFEYDDTLLL